MLIKGRHLTPQQRTHVLKTYVNRFYSIGPEKHYATEEAWLNDHAFYFLKDGSRLARNRRYCEPN